jgi:hypothetical protein
MVLGWKKVWKWSEDVQISSSDIHLWWTSGFDNYLFDIVSHISVFTRGRTSASGCSFWYSAAVLLCCFNDLLRQELVLLECLYNYNQLDRKESSHSWYGSNFLLTCVRYVTIVSLGESHSDHLVCWASFLNCIHLQPHQGEWCANLALSFVITILGRISHDLSVKSHNMTIIQRCFMGIFFAWILIYFMTIQAKLLPIKGSPYLV